MLLHVKVKPNERRDKIEKRGNEWLIRLKAPAQDGKANQHLIGFLNKVLDNQKLKNNNKEGQRARTKCLN